MKEYVLQLIEELVGAHSYGQKRTKADEIAAIVKTAVFAADQFEHGDPSAENAALSTLANESPLPAE
ncbi:MAG: hypothetical protein M3O20_13495 [Acidobacteriota bacterium]|nr:hypothetical protein [Acidobacteriota bacterium]